MKDHHNKALHWLETNTSVVWKVLNEGRDSERLIATTSEWNLEVIGLPEGGYYASFYSTKKREDILGIGFGSELSEVIGEAVENARHRIPEIVNVFNGYDLAIRRALHTLTK